MTIILSCGLAILGSPAPCLAQVMEIDGSGGVQVYDGPTVFTADGAAPVSIPRPAPIRRAKRRPASMAPRELATAGPIGDAASAATLSPSLIAAVAWQESRGHSDAVSRAGALGEMQLMPNTARALGVDARDSRQNYRGGAAYLRQLLDRYHGDLIRTLAAYNAGPRQVDAYGGVPPFKETQAYVAGIMDHLGQMSLDGMEPPR